MTARVDETSKGPPPQGLIEGGQIRRILAVARLHPAFAIAQRDR